MRTPAIEPIADIDVQHPFTRRSENPSVAWILATVAEQAELQELREKRREIRNAIERAECGHQLSCLDFDVDDPTRRAAYETAYKNVLEERERVDRAAAALLSYKRIHNRWPPL